MTTTADNTQADPIHIFLSKRKSFSTPTVLKKQWDIRLLDTRCQVWLLHRHWSQCGQHRLLHLRLPQDATNLLLLIYLDFSPRLSCSRGFPYVVMKTTITV